MTTTAPSTERRRRTVPRRPWPAEVPRRRVNCYVVNGRLVDVFDALCLIESWTPAQLVHEAVRSYCEARAKDEVVVRFVALRRRHQSGLRRVK